LTLTHLFGELDIDLSKTYNEIYHKLFDIGESCGYYVTQSKNKLHVSGGDNMAVQIEFTILGKVVKVTRAQFYDSGEILVNWHEVKVGSYVPI